MSRHYSQAAPLWWEKLRRWWLIYHLGEPEFAFMFEPPPPGERLVGSVAAALMAAERGASILRVHDVRETVQALQVLAAVRAAGERPGA